MIDTADKAVEAFSMHAKRHPPMRAPLRERTGGCKEKFLIPRCALFFPAGAPFITEIPRQGALGGLTPLHNEPAACGRDVKDGDSRQGEDHDLVEPGLEVPGPFSVMIRGELFAI